MLDLQIGIPCGPNSEYFANFLITTIELTISKTIDYRFLIGINKPGVNIDIITKNLDQSKFDFVEDYSDKNSSAGHAHCLNLMLKNMSSKFGVFLDSDVAVLERDWDVLLLNKLNQQTVMIGSEYHHSDGKMINRPNVITCAFNVDIFKKLNLDFTPSLKTIVMDEKTSKIYGAPIGKQVMLDTGCEIMENIILNGYQTETLKIVSPRYSDTTKKLKVLDSRQRGEEYHLNNRPISTHIGRSLSRNFKNDPIVKNWIESVERWVYGEV